MNAHAARRVIQFCSGRPFLAILFASPSCDLDDARDPERHFVLVGHLDTLLSEAASPPAPFTLPCPHIPACIPKTYDP